MSVAEEFAEKMKATLPEFVHVGPIDHPEVEGEAVEVTMRMGVALPMGSVIDADLEAARFMQAMLLRFDIALEQWSDEWGYSRPEGPAWDKIVEAHRD